MRRLATIAAALLLFALLFTGRNPLEPPPVYAEPLSDTTRQLLENGLSVVEIDREIERISGLRKEAERSIAQNETKLAERQIAIAAQREKAGRVLRAYYMGQKEAMLGVLVSFKSWSALLRSWDLMDTIFEADRRTLADFNREYEEIRAGQDKLRRDKDELARVAADLERQRDRVAALQLAIERAIDGSEDPALARKQLEEMQAYWENAGLYEVRRHFGALAKAMNKLPDWIQKHPEALKTKGLSTTLTLTDVQLNEFLHAQSELLKDFSIAFKPNLLSLHGKSGSMEVSVEGSYAVVNEPKNAIMFHMDKLVFNGFALPDTTRDDLVRNFDLGFYPQQVMSYLKADSVSLEDGKLIVKLKLGK
ncbi:coiled-coil domain-containing protein [Cohnella sp. JJ-181]|uniref:coiled-coil domain-containing protein n=1 Tax=Cohnella rhizoplanae TaxID=2974897 RepID=UPI0022FFA267|nr:hypothetical protein [Cohnella sp. JJ-181]CAI6019824.1 hypothetical protein COHCIP112018_00259 [Cohnella sp. JJ-181]